MKKNLRTWITRILAEKIDEKISEEIRLTSVFHFFVDAISVTRVPRRESRLSFTDYKFHALPRIRNSLKNKNLLSKEDKRGGGKARFIRGTRGARIKIRMK